MKRILILCPTDQNKNDWDKVAKVRAEYFDAGNYITDLQEVHEHFEWPKDVDDLEVMQLVLPGLDLLARVDEVLLMPNWKESKECKILEAICRIYGIPVRSAIPADLTNFAVRKYGTQCPLQTGNTDDESTLVSETQCKPCAYCKGTNPTKQKVICKVYPDL